MKDLKLVLHGSSHFLEHHHQFQTRLRHAVRELESTHRQQLFSAVHIHARGGAEMSQGFIHNFRDTVKEFNRRGFAQIHVILLGDNDLRRAIRSGGQEKGHWKALQLKSSTKKVLRIVDDTKDCFIIVISPLPSPKFRRYLSCFHSASRLMKEAVTESMSPNATFINTFRRWTTPIYHRRTGDVTALKIVNEFFSNDGVHLNRDGVEDLIMDIATTLLRVPSCYYPSDLRFHLNMRFYNDDLRSLLNTR